MNTRTVALAAVTGMAILAQAAEFHVTSAQELQNALTTAAVNGEGDTVYVAAGYYTGNFNFNSAEAQSLTLQAESGVANTEITIDGAGTGRSMNLTATAAANLTVRGLTFTRNCNDYANNAGLRLSTQGGDVLVENCRAIGVSSDLGIGIQVAAAKLATVRGCTVTRDATSKGDGIFITGVTGGVTVDRNVVIGNRTSRGLGVYVSVGSTVPVTASENNVHSNYCYSSSEGGITCYGTAALTGNVVTATDGKGIFCFDSNARLTANSVRNNSGTGIYCYGSGATLTGNTVSGNSGDSAGGIYCSGTATLTGNTVSGNSGTSYGGIYCSGTATLTGNTVSGNNQTSTGSSNYGGGGIYCNSTATLTGNTVTDNTAAGGWGGGGICCRSGADFVRNTVLGNRSTYSGGGLSIQGSTVKLQCNIVGKNTQTQAGYAGGGIWVKATTLLDMINNTVTENAAAGNGGGAAFQVDGTTEILHVYNNILWGNTADGNGDDVHVAGSGSRKEFLYNDAHDLYGVWDITSNNIDAAPLFYDAANQNYHLRNGSPCLNAGYNAAPSIPATDIDNEARIVDTTVDIGADEMSNTDPHPADLNDDWVISEAEYTAYAAAWKNDQAWSRQPSPVPADFVTRAGYLRQQAGGSYRNDGGPKPTCWVPN